MSNQEINNTTVIDQPESDKIEIVVRRTSSTQFMTKQELLDIIAESRELITDHKQIAEQAKIDIVNGNLAQDAKYWRGNTWGGGIHKGDLKRHGYHDWTHDPLWEKHEIWDHRTRGYIPQPPTHVEQSRLDGVIDDCDYMLGRLEFFERRLNKGTLRPGDWIFKYGDYVQYVSHEGEQRIAKGLYTISIPDIVACEICGRIVKISEMNKHNERQVCKDIGRRRAVEKRGYQRVYKGDKLFSLGKDARLNNVELIPTDYDVYVPVWMVDAAQTFIKHITTKNTGINAKGYAGMTLDEFLNKMEPPNESV